MTYEEIVESTQRELDRLHQSIVEHKDAIRACCERIDEQRTTQAEARRAIAREARKAKAAEYRAKTLAERRAYSRGYAAALRASAKNTE